MFGDRPLGVVETVGRNGFGESLWAL